MDNPNRINPLTVANAEEDARLRSVSSPAGSGTSGTSGTFSPWARLALTVVAFTLPAVGVALAAPVVTLPIILGALVTGAGTGLAAWLGISSSGMTRPPGGES